MDPAPALTIRRLRISDAAALCAFYNGLSEASRRTFRPLGDTTTLEACHAVCQANAVEEKYDLVALDGDAVVGWGFVWKLSTPEPMFGLAVADALHGQGLGTDLTQRVLQQCDQRHLARVVLSVVKDNHRAKGIYERNGFVTYGEFYHEQDKLDYYRMERLRVPAPDAGHRAMRNVWIA